MRIVVAIAAAAALAALVVSATLAITGPDASRSEQARRGKLVQVSAQPLTLKGSGFVASEKVQVSASTSGAKETRTVKANGSGSFTVSFSRKLNACNGLTVSAVGNKGTRTSFQLSQLVCLDE